MKKVTIRVLALVLAFLMAFSLAACGSDNTPGGSNNNSSTNANTPGTNAETPSTEDKGTSTVYVQIKEDPGLDPFLSGEFLLGQLVCEMLFAYNYQGYVVPGCLDSYEIAEDGMSMTLHVPENLETFNGFKVTAPDYLWCLNQAAKGNDARMVKFMDLENSYVEDDLTLVVAFKEKWTDFNFANLTLLPITSREAYESDPEGAYNMCACGTGPYKVVSHTEGSEIILEKNENYWGGSEDWGARNVDRIVAKVISENAQKTIEFETGNIDFISDPGTNDIEYLDSLDEADVYQVAQIKNIALNFNCVQGPTSNKLVRQAIGYAIDNVAICEQALGGQKIPATTVINPTNVEWDDSMYTQDGRYAYNVEKAKELLAEAGYPDGFGVEICYTEARGAYLRLMAQIIQEQLGQIGITVTLTPYDSAAFNTLIAGTDGWDINLNSYTLNGSVLFHFYNLTNANVVSRGGWFDEEFQEMLEYAVYHQDDTGNTMKMVEMYEEEQPFYTIAYDTSFFVARNGIEDVKFKGNNWYYPSDWTYGAGCDSWLYD